MNSEQFELFTTLFVLNLAKQLAVNSNTPTDKDSQVDKVNNNDLNLFSGQQPEPPTPPRTPTTAASTSSSNGEQQRTPSSVTPKLVEERQPTITLTPTSKLMADFRRFSEDNRGGAETYGHSGGGGGHGSDVEDHMDNFSDRGSNPSFDLSRFNDDSNNSEVSDQESDMGMTIDSQNSLDGRISLPPVRKLMDNKNSPTPLAS